MDIGDQGGRVEPQEPARPQPPAGAPRSPAAQTATPTRGPGARRWADAGLAVSARGRSEAALVRAAQRGSEAAVAALFELHWSAAHRAALLVTGDRAAAEDIAQEAFLAALRALPTFDLRRPLRPWLHRIVINRSIDWSRARALRREVGADMAPDPVAPVAGDVPDLDAEVTAALMGLGAEHRAVIVLRYVLEFTPGEIGRLLGLPRGTVNSRLRRGLDALGEVIEPERR